MTDRKMHDAVDKSVRGGVCCISHKYAAANNPYLGDTYNPYKSSTYTIYLDINKIPGTAMSETIPVKDFDFLLDKQVTSFDFFQRRMIVLKAVT